MKVHRETKSIKNRIAALFGLLLVAFGALMFGYFHIQVLQRHHFSELGERYRTRQLPLRPERGLFFARGGQLLTENQPSYSLVLLREALTIPWGEALAKLATFLDLPQAELEENFQLHRQRFLSLPLPVYNQLPFEKVLRMKRMAETFPWADIEVTTERHYLAPHLFCHLLGYVGQPSKDFLNNHPGIRPGEAVGRSGLELIYNEALRGQYGQKAVQIDSKGRFHKETIVLAPQMGQSFHLTIDPQLQRLAQNALIDQAGTVLLMSVQTGEILVYFSAPSFDLNLFRGGISQADWQALVEEEKNPLFNRPIQGLYAPGSIFKMVTLLAGLKQKTIDFHTEFHCSGSMNYLNRDFHCHKETGHGTMDFTEALVQSCNVYTYQVAKLVGAEAIAQMAKDLGLGQKTGVDLPGEQSGLVPDPAWKKEVRHDIWFPGETLSMSIGQGDLQLTPIQILRFMALIANRGVAPTPHLLKDHPAALQEPLVSHIHPEAFQLIKRGLWKTVHEESGTGRRARVEGFDVCGKTGTAQRITFKNDLDRKEVRYQNAWFAGFAPYEKPEVAIVVLLEQAGHGGESAAPVAQKILQAYLHSDARRDLLDAI